MFSFYILDRWIISLLFLHQIATNKIINKMTYKEDMNFKTFVYMRLAR
jgi:hypothetical protein